MLLWILLAATFVGIAVFATFYKTAALDVAYGFACMSWWWVAGLLSLYYASRLIGKHNAPASGWQTAPINSYRFETRLNDGRTLRLSELDLTADERLDLQKFAAMRAKNPDVTFTAVSVKTYRTLKDKLMAAKWLEWNKYNSEGKPVTTYGVSFTQDGMDWLAELLPPPVEGVSQYVHLYPHTHTQEAQNEHKT